MSDTIVTPQKPIDPFNNAGTAPALAPTVDGVDINSKHAGHVDLALTIIADAKQAMEAQIARIPDDRGQKSLGSLRSALSSVWHDLNRAEQYQRELAAFLPPVSQE